MTAPFLDRSLLHLRCIEVNGDWDVFMDYVHDRMNAEFKQNGALLRLQSRDPAPLPTAKEAA